MTGPTARERADEFLKIADQFRLGSLVTESPHPVTMNLSEVASTSIPDALRLLFQVDLDVVAKYREWASTDAPARIAKTVLKALLTGGRIFFTGCGSTGRLSILLDSIWRDFWQQHGGSAWQDSTFSVMAGGDFALIKSVEGFEDSDMFGMRQIADAPVLEKDIVFAITEGGETSFVIGTVWQALAMGAKTYFVYNNPDEILRATVERSRKLLDLRVVEKINLTTGPMAITGSTRMQATTIQLCVMLTVMEMVLREMKPDSLVGPASEVPEKFAAKLEEMHAWLSSDETVLRLAKLVSLEESVYRTGGRVNYFADGFAIDVLTDTTERSPTFCVPPFRRFDDAVASESWAFLFMPYEDTPAAWERLLKREPRAVTWPEWELAEVFGDEEGARLSEVMRRISLDDIYKFRIGMDGLQHRGPRPGDAAIGVGTTEELAQGFIAEQLSVAASAGARTDVIRFDAPETDFLLGGVTRVGVKMLLNALSTCTMVRLGRVMGNFMVYVVPSNLKLIDRATRYVSKLSGLPYESACRLLFEVIEYVEPRMMADQAYPPVVAMAVIRAGSGVSNEEAEATLAELKIHNS